MTDPTTEIKFDIGRPFTALRALSPFSLFSDKELEELVPLSEIQKFPPEVNIVTEGDPSDNRVYFLLEGEVSVHVGGNFILGLKRTGDIFGEMSLISDEPRSATVRTDTEASLLVVNSALTFDPGEGRYYKFRYYFSRMFNAILTDKLRMTSERAKLYEDAVRLSRQATEQTTGLQEQIRRNLDQIHLYSHLVESAKDGILIVNTSGGILEANPSLKSEFGLEPQSLIGLSLNELLRPEPTGPGCWDAIQPAAAEGGWSGEVYVAVPGKRSIPADCSISLVQGSNREGLAYSVILRNIKQRKASEKKIEKQSEALVRANRELRELDRLKDNFLTLVSHELRTPLTSIVAYAETLSIEGMVEPEEREQFLAVIHSEALRLNELLNKVLTISKIESGQMLFDFEEGRLDDLIQMSVANFKEQVEAKNLALVTEVKGTIGRTVFDSARIQEVLDQILKNSLQNTESGSIKVAISQGPKETLIEIEDTGKGMKGNLIAGAFTKFNWVENIQHHQSGIGLGLPLSFLIVDAHSGTMRVRSEVGKGTTVSVVLPHLPAQAVEAS